MSDRRVRAGRWTNNQRTVLCRLIKSGKNYNVVVNVTRTSPMMATESDGGGPVYDVLPARQVRRPREWWSWSKSNMLPVVFYNSQNCDPRRVYYCMNDVWIFSCSVSLTLLGAYRRSTTTITQSIFRKSLLSQYQPRLICLDIDITLEIKIISSEKSTCSKEFDRSPCGSITTRVRTLSWLQMVWSTLYFCNVNCRLTSYAVMLAGHDFVL